VAEILEIDVVGVGVGDTDGLPQFLVSRGDGIRD